MMRTQTEKQIHDKLSMAIDTDGTVIKVSKNFARLLKSRPATIYDIIHFKDDINDTRELIDSYFTGDVKEPVTRDITINLGERRYLYSATFKPLIKGGQLKAFDVSIQSHGNGDVFDRELMQYGFDMQLKEEYKKLDKLSVKLCSMVSDELFLSNLFVFNDQNTFTIRHWDITPEVRANLISKENQEQVKILRESFCYHYMTHDSLDSFIDSVFFKNAPYYLDQRGFSVISRNFSFLFNMDPNLVIDHFNEIQEKLEYTWFALVPIVYKSVRLGCYLIMKSQKFTKLEKRAIAEIRDQAISMLSESEVITSFIQVKKDMSAYEHDFSAQFYKMLYEAYLAINKTSNIHDLKYSVAKFLKTLTNADYISYYDYDPNKGTLVPFYVNEDSDTSGKINSFEFSTNNGLGSRLFTLKKPITLNFDYPVRNNLLQGPHFIKKNRSFLFMPVFLSSVKPAGLFLLTKTGGKSFTRLNLATASTFVGNALIKYKEYLSIKENTDSKTKYKALYETILALNTSSNITTTLDLIAKIASNLVSSDTVVMYKIEDGGGQLSAIYSNEKIDIRIKTFEHRIDLGNYLVGRTCQDGIIRFLNMEDYDPDQDSCPDNKPKSIMTIPLKIKDRIMGGMVLFRYSSNNFTSNDLETIIPFAQQAINIYYQNILLQKNKEQQELYKTLNETLLYINTCHNIDQIFEMIARQASKLVYANKSYIYLMDEDKKFLNPIFVFDKPKFVEKVMKLPIPVGKGIAGLSALEGKPIISNYEDTENDRSFIKKIDGVDYKNISVLAIPLIVEDEIKGVLHLGKINREKFLPEDIDKLMPFANQIISTIYTGTIETQLQTTQRNYGAFVNTIRDQLIHIQDNFRCELLNNNYESVFKDDPPSEQYFNFLDLIYPRDTNDFIKNYNKAIAGEFFYSYRFRYQSLRSGNIVFVEMNLYIRRDEDDNFIESYAILKNIDEIVKLEGRLIQNEKMIKENQKKTIKTFATLLAARDDDTGNHLLRIEEYTRSLCAAMAHDEKYKPFFKKYSIEDIADASILHDVGKISIQDNILQKPGKLDPEEWKIMKTHTLYGAKTLNVANRGIHYDYLILGESIAHYHHERWDGTGYPEGLSGEEIPLEARIVAVVDVYDALRVKRTYKEAKSHEETIELIISLGGTFFDPHIIEIFENVHADFKAIADRLMDVDTETFAKGIIESATK
jgi:response regulator RpfG family c-di-GMP phosphodiesterase/transcriptional regulator with GAF, ATPase, and Fis domain